MAKRRLRVDITVTFPMSVIIEESDIDAEDFALLDGDEQCDAIRTLAREEFLNYGFKDGILTADQVVEIAGDGDINDELFPPINCHTGE